MPALAATLRSDGEAATSVVTLATPFVPEPAVGLLPAPEELAEIDRRGSATGEADLATILFTSGTTVAPKAVLLTHGNYLANVRDLVPVMRLSRERLLSLLPVHHAFEQTVGLLVPLAGASSVSYVAEIRPAEISWMMASTRPTMMVVVPRLLGLLHAGILRSVEEGGPKLQRIFKVLFALSKLTGGRQGHRLFAKVHRRFGGSLRRIASGGSALEPSLGESFRWMGFQVAEGYGMTETAPVLTVNPWDAIRFGSVGRPLPGVDIELRPPGDATGVEPGAGEVWVRGANVMSGYLDNPAATAAVMDGDWLNTGDIGRFDDEGYLYLSGRTMDVIVTAAGKNVYPEEVERRYRDVDGAEELVVLGLPGPGGAGAGEVLGAVVVPGPSAGDAEIEALRAAVADRSAQIPSYHRITRLEVWRGELPKTTTMKVRRRLLRDAVVRGDTVDAPAGSDAGPAPAPPSAAASGAGPPPSSEAETWALDFLARLTHTRPDRLTPGTRLADLGLDSLGHAEVLGALETRRGQRLGEAEVAALIHVSDVVDSISSA